MTPKSQTTSGTYAQVGGSTTKEDESGLSYSTLGPVYETVNSGRHQGSQDQ